MSTRPEKASAKIVVEFRSYHGMVLDADKALQVMNLLRGAETFKDKYNGSSGNTLHVYTDPTSEYVTFRYLTDEQYALAKVAGAPVG